MRLHQIDGHGEWVVQVGERAGRVRGACVEHGLGGGFNIGAVFVGWVFWPRVVVVDDAGGITVVAF